MKMYFEILLLIIIFAIFIYPSFYLVQNFITPGTKQSSSNFVCFDKNCFQVELAKTEAEREHGLMDREQLGQNKGMLFIFDKEGIYPFWMKKTLIPLDMIWIDNNKVVFISQNVQPCKSLICPMVTPTAQAKYVLEINAGVCREIGLKIGDEVKINID